MTGSIPKDTISKDRFTSSRLVALFKTLSKTEVKAFSKYLTGTSYKADNAVFQLFFFLKKYHPHYCEKKINTKLVWEYCFDEKEVNKKKLLQLCTNLVKVLEDFLIKLQLEKSQPERDFLLLHAFKDRKLDNQFFQKVKEVRKKWEKYKPPGIEQLHNEYKLESLYSGYKETTNINLIMNAMQIDIDNLDIYYLARRLHLSHTLALSKNYFSNVEDQNEKSILRNLLTLSNQLKYEKIPAIHLSNLIFKDLLSGEFDNYDKIKGFFYQTFEQYSQIEQTDILDFLIHYCMQNESKGDKNALSNLFNLTKWAVENKIYVKDGYINNHQFNTIVNIACRAKEFNWAEKFIVDNSNYLEKSIRYDIVANCNATCLFFAKKYKEVVDQLSIIKFTNISIAVNSRCLQLMACAELKGNDIFFFNSVKLLRGVIKRDRVLTKKRKENLSKFIYLIKIIYKMRYRKKINTIEIEKILKLETHLPYRRWFMNKLQNYKRK